MDCIRTVFGVMTKQILRGLAFLFLIFLIIFILINTSNIKAGELDKFNYYFGQLHSHTNLSDGKGSSSEAFKWARDEGKADFFAITDHSNKFDNDLDYTKSNEWLQLKKSAQSFNKNGKFIAIAGFEMTWTNKLGHMNTFNTEWFETRSNPAMKMQGFYNKLINYPNAIAQFNHPGTTFGDFQDFSYYSESIDKVIDLIEVGNGDGLVGGKGYFKSYDYYSKALDKGWHIAPTNNQDNHNKNWITSNDCRTVILATELTKESLYDSIKKLRVYATEDKNLKVTFQINNNIMGSIIKKTQSINISADINDPDNNDIVGSIELITNGGKVVISKYFNSNQAQWSFSMSSTSNNYYYIRITQKDGEMAVSSPIWVGSDE